MAFHSTVLICSESEEYRGEFRVEPSLWHDIGIMGYIEPHHGERVYVRSDPLVGEMLQIDAPYVLVTADEVEECQDVRLVSIRSYIPMKSLESPGQMACGC